MLPRIAFPFLISLSDAGPITSDIELKVSIDQFIPRVNSEKFQNFHLLALIVSFQFWNFKIENQNQNSAYLYQNYEEFYKIDQFWPIFTPMVIYTIVRKRSIQTFITFYRKCHSD